MRPTFAQIEYDAIINNTKILKQCSKDLLFIAVKANAYGHGAINVAKCALKNGADYLGVATIEEGIELREAQITAPILVLGGTLFDDYQLLCDYNIDITVYNDEQLLELNRIAKKNNGVINVHLKIDTGMGRIGVAPKAFKTSLELIKKCDNLNLQGVSTHLAIADDKTGTEYTSMQFDTFNSCIDVLEGYNFNPIIHICNSAGTFLYNDKLNYSKKYSYMNRVGISLYGYSYVDTGKYTLKPALTWKTKVVHLKTIEKGQCVSYGCEFNARRQTVVATLPVGYADGYKRSYKNGGYVLIGGKCAPVIGRVCMDHFMVDVSDIANVNIGSDVILLGSDNFGNSITATDLAKIDGTINYEVLTSISYRVKRIYVGELHE